eukprot:m.355471 g.355471  ORF g.355471 m.355471 type:complete len:356 (+) comp19924_c1_seq1:589-1656(+)
MVMFVLDHTIDDLVETHGGLVGGLDTVGVEPVAGARIIFDKALWYSIPTNIADALGHVYVADSARCSAGEATYKGTKDGRKYYSTDKASSRKLSFIPLTTNDVVTEQPFFGQLDGFEVGPDHHACTAKVYGVLGIENALKTVQLPAGPVDIKGIRWHLPQHVLVRADTLKLVIKEESVEIHRLWLCVTDTPPANVVARPPLAVGTLPLGSTLTLPSSTPAQRLIFRKPVTVPPGEVTYQGYTRTGNIVVQTHASGDDLLVLVPRNNFAVNPAVPTPPVDLSVFSAKQRQRLERVVAQIHHRLHTLEVRGVVVYELQHYRHCRRGLRVPVYIVGGAVRDALSGEDINDIDLAIGRR